MATTEQNVLVLPSEVLQKKFSLATPEQKLNHKLNKNRSSNVYAFKVGDLGLMLESEKIVSEVLDSLPMCSIPNAPRWLYSMANLRGNITPVFDLMDIFEFDNEINIDTKKVLIIGTKEQAVGILIDEIPFKIVLNESDKVAVSAELPKKLSPYVRACYEKDNAIWVNWDVASFFKSFKV